MRLQTSPQPRPTPIEPENSLLAFNQSPTRRAVVMSTRGMTCLLSEEIVTIPRRRINVIFHTTQIFPRESSNGTVPAPQPPRPSDTSAPRRPSFSAVPCWPANRPQPGRAATAAGRGVVAARQASALARAPETPKERPMKALLYIKRIAERRIE